MNKFRIAEHLHKFVHEVDEIPASELVGWYAFFNVKAREQAKAEAEAKAKAKTNGRSKRVMG